MKKFDSISHFLESGGFSYRIFDMGRKVTSISKGQFQKIENQECAYPSPFQRNAWIALLFWTQEEGEKKNPVIWFLKFPIDEMGFLKQDARDSFLISLLEQAGKNIQAKQAGEVGQDDLSESPFAFKPQADRLAIFHALATVELEQQPSQYYQFAHDYLTDDVPFEQWQFLGLQGVADVMVRLEQDDNEVLLESAIAFMPNEPLFTFCQLLENVNFSEGLTQSLNDKLMLTLGENSAELLPLQSMLVRALTGSQSESMRQDVLMLVLESSIGKEIEILAAISGRAWNDLCQKELLAVFMLNLANQSQMAFNAILTDLMMIPKMKALVLEQMRVPDRPAELSLKLSEFMKAIKH
ncbi:MAG: DUF3549 family protein [Cocleimonas sp.]